MATTSAFPHLNQAIGQIAFCPELVQGTPNYSLTADGGSNTGTAVTIDSTSGATHNNNIAAITANYFQGLQVYFLPNTATAALRGKAYNISASSAPSGGVVTLTVGTMAATPAGNETFYVIGALPAEKTMPETTTDNLPRKFHKLTLDDPSSVKGLSRASGSLVLEMAGLNTPLASSATPTKDRFSVFLETFFGTRTAAAGTTVSGSGSSTTVVDVTSAAGFAVDDVVIISGQARRITAVDTASTPDNITLHRALSAAPSASTEVYNTEQFKPVDTGHRTGTLLFLTDDRLVVVYGCIGSIKLSAPFGEFVKGTFDFNGEWAPAQTSDGAALGGYQLDKDPVPFISTANCDFGGNALSVNALEFDTGSTSQDIKDTEAGVRYFIRERSANCKVVFRDQAKTPKTTWENAGTKGRLLVCAGAAAGSLVGVEGWAQIGDPIAQSEVNMTAYWDAGFRFFDDQDSNDATKPRIIRG